MKELNIRKFTDAPKQMVISKWIKAPLQDVWEVVSDHEGMTQWIPMIKQVDLVEANAAGEWGEGCERHCKFGTDLLKEKIVHWDPPFGYAYMIGDMHLVKNHLGHFKLEETNGGTLVTWTQYFYPNGNAIKRWMAKNIMLPSVMKKGLKNLQKNAA